MQSFKYHSTGQFRQVVKNVQTAARYKGQDENGDAIIDTMAVSPTLEYIGTTKLHGTNANIVVESPERISFHSKNNLLGYYEEEDFTLLSDNAEFAQTMSRRISGVAKIIDNVTDALIAIKGDSDIYPFKISGEWCGAGIQKGVGISYLDKKSLFIFGIKCKEDWMPLSLLDSVTGKEEDGLYSITSFPTFKVVIDFNNPQDIQNRLIEDTKFVETRCPVSYVLGLKDEEGTPQTLGEGIVWTPLDTKLIADSGLWFKTKGEKHSISKVKTLVPVDTEKLDSIKEFVEYAVTDNRLEQGVSETGEICNKNIGAFLSWVSKDINKEEGDTLESNNLTMKDVGKSISTKARMWYMNKL